MAFWILYIVCIVLTGLFWWSVIKSQPTKIQKWEPILFGLFALVPYANWMMLVVCGLWVYLSTDYWESIKWVNRFMEWLGSTFEDRLL